MVSMVVGKTGIDSKTRSCEKIVVMHRRSDDAVWQQLQVKFSLCYSVLIIIIFSIQPVLSFICMLSGVEATWDWARCHWVLLSEFLSEPAYGCFACWVDAGPTSHWELFIPTTAAGDSGHRLSSVDCFAGLVRVWIVGGVFHAEKWWGVAPQLLLCARTIQSKPFCHTDLL